MQSVILTTGGTGGHIFPALAVAEEIRARYPSAMILFMGGEYGPEADIAAKAGLDFVGLPVRGVVGRGLRGLAAAFGMLRGILKAWRVIRKTRPQIVVGFGGYAAFAGVAAARLAKVPAVLHEQNSLPGVANKLLGKVAQRIFLSMPDEGHAFAPEKCRLVGNPVRAGIVELYERGAETPPPRAPRLLVMGGSQGARAINRGVLAIHSALLEAGVEIWHQTGQADYEFMRAGYKESGAERVRVEAFITDMPRAYAWADLALCRAGATSLAELTTAGLAAVLVPFPAAARDHQRHNARFLEKAGGALIIEQAAFAECTAPSAQGSGGDPAVLARLLLDLLADRARLTAMSRKSLEQAKPYAARELVSDLDELLGNREP